MLVNPRIVAALAAVFLVAASPSLLRAQQAQQSNSIVIKNFDYSPMSVTVKAGSTVTWKNLDDEPHTVTSLDGLFRSGALDTGDKFAFKFDKPGIYKYACSIHPRMMGTIIVQ
jgi:plastocyanin